MVAPVLLFLTALLVFFVAWRLATPRHAMASGLVALVFFSLSPAVLAKGFHGVSFQPIADALFALFFVGAWLLISHWSVFMRTLVLAVLFGAGLWTRSASLAWILLAMIPWVFFNRRPLAAVGSFIAVLAGGSALFWLSWVGVCFLEGRTTAFLQPHHELLAAIRVLWTQAQGATMEVPLSSFRGLVFYLTLPWALLSLWTAAGLFKTLMRERRADVAGYIAALIGVTFGVCLYEGSQSSTHVDGALLMWVALSAPLVARDVSQRDFLMSRSARLAAGFGFVLSGAAQAALAFLAPGTLPERLSGFAVILIAMFGALALARRQRPSQPLDFQAQWRAVLVGSALSCALVVDVFLMKL